MYLNIYIYIFKYLYKYVIFSQYFKSKGFTFPNAHFYPLYFQPFLCINDYLIYMYNVLKLEL